MIFSFIFLRTYHQTEARMKKLSKDWITEKLIDFEYKKYILLAYLQDVSQYFGEAKLYPYLSDLVEHYRDVVALRESKETIYNRFPKQANGADWEKFRLLYNKMVQDDEIMQSIESILQFSIPKFEYYLAEGKKIYDFVEEHINISPVGISPLNTHEGYLFLQNGDNKSTHVYEYQVTIFEDASEKYRAIRTQFLTTYTRSITNTCESIKTDLLRYNRKFPNPATYVIESEIELPREETFLPVAKRALVKYLAAC
jgi:hypothetical protein